jgi:O-antigen ligase
LFFLLGLVFAAAGSAVASPSLWLAAIASLLAIPLADRRPSAAGVTPIALVVWAYVVWLVGTNLTVSAAYTPAGIFNPAFLVAGFLIARGSDEVNERRMAVVVLAVVATLATAGLVQVALGQGRASAHFETPNTLATVINLALAPLLVLIAAGRNGAWLSGAAALLVAGLVATLSRGGVASLAAALLIARLLAAPRASARASARLLIVLLAGALFGLLALAMPALTAWLNGHEQHAPVDVVATFGPSLAARIELGRLALSSIPEHAWLGVGYTGFRGLLEAGRALVPSYGTENITFFVHNDYLQSLVELGVAGFLTMVALVLIPFVQMARRADKADVHLGAILAALAAMAVHALVDFPFYIPLCLLLYGLALGRVDRLLAAPVERTPAFQARVVPRIGAIATAAAAFVLLVPPAAAEAAALYADTQWRAGRAQNAAFGFELAWRLQPRDWRYHWYAGQFWTAQAALSHKPAAARLADEAFAAGVSANPHEAKCLLGRIALRLGYAALLGAPTDAPTLREWADRALAAAPLNPVVRSEHAALLSRLEARQ